jgi:hypothetical protein
MLVSAILFLSIAAPGRAAAQVELNDGKIPGSVLVFPKFVRGAVNVGGESLPRTEFNISVTCPLGATCPDGREVKLMARWICPASQDLSQKFVCRSTDFELRGTVKSTIVFGAHATSTTIPIPTSLTSVQRVPAPPCPEGFLVVWVISPGDGSSPSAIKFDALVGHAVVRVAGDSAGAYKAVPIQAVSGLATEAPTDVNLDGRLQFDGLTEYKAVTGQVTGTVRFERPTPTDPSYRSIETYLTLLTLDTLPNRPNLPTFVDFHFFNENEVLISSFHDFICWSQVRLTAIDPNLDEFFGTLGLVESTHAEKIAFFGIADTPGPVTLLGIVETRESSGEARRQYGYLMFNDGQPVTNVMTAYVLRPLPGQPLTGVAALQATAHDSSGVIQRIEFLVDGDAAPVCADATAKASGATFQCSWDSASKPNGSYAVRARAYDLAGNAAESAPVPFTISNVDGNPPSAVQVLVPSSGQTIAGPVALQASAGDGGGTIQRIEFYIDTEDTPACADTLSKASGSTFQCTWDPATRPDGPHTVWARAWDPAGNSADSAPVAFTIDHRSTLSVSISGGGTASSDPSGIACSAGTCTGEFQSGSLVTLAAVAQAGWRFAGWGGACAGTAGCAAILSADTAVTATFAPVEELVQLDIAVTGNGTVTSTPGGMSCPPTCSAQFTRGASVTLTASAIDGVFDGWTGDCSGTGSCTLVMSASKAVTAQVGPGDTSAAATLVRGLYREVLGRTPSAAEVSAWVNHLASTPQPSGAQDMIRVFLSGPENRGRATTLAAYVRLLYSVTLGRVPAAAEVDAWVGALTARFNRLVPGFVNSPEFLALGLSTPPHDVVRRLYQQTLGRSPSAEEVNGWVDILNLTGDWETVAIGFLNSPEYLGTPRSFGDHIVVLYRTFLGRQPAPAEVAAWLDVLSGYLRDIEDGFINSQEFAGRIASLSP